MKKTHIYWNAGTGGPVDYQTVWQDVTAPPFTTPALSYPGDYTFAARNYDTVTGEEEANVTAAVRLVLDAAGADVTLAPTPPVSVSAVALSGGRVRARWGFRVSFGPAAPTGFLVRAWPASGAPDMTVRLAVPYTPSNTRFTTNGLGDLPSLADGVRYAVLVTAVNATGESLPPPLAYATASGVGPLPVVSGAASAVA